VAFTDDNLTAKIEPFDTFWEGPENVSRGYSTFEKFYRKNYLKHLPQNKEARILVISCGPGYFVDLLTKAGYINVTGIDSSNKKVHHAQEKGLNCHVARAFEYLQRQKDKFDAIFCEQEINHLTKDEIVAFFALCHQCLANGGTFIVHSLNGANPVTGAEALAQNFNHYNTFTEYSLRQVLAYTGFEDIKVIPLRLYVFYLNPVNYVLMLLDAVYTLCFRLSFMLYGKSNRIFTKKIAAICRRRA